MTKYKLIYFNGMGRAELIRLIFALKEIPYEDVRIDKAEWLKLKPTTPFGQLPILEEDGKVLAQSLAIATYLAAKYKLNGCDDWEAAKIQELFGVCNDLTNFAIPYIKEENETKKKDLGDAFEKEHLEPFFRKMNELLARNGTGYFVGKELTVIDLHLMSLFGLFGYMRPNTAAKYPDLMAFKDKIAGIPQIKKWIETRPKTEV